MQQDSLVNNRILRSAVTVFLFTRILASYVWFGLVTQVIEKDEKKRRQILAKKHAVNATKVYNALCG